jgi:hypothetical protein
VLARRGDIDVGAALHAVMNAGTSANAVRNVAFAAARSLPGDLPASSAAAQQMQARQHLSQDGEVRRRRISVTITASCGADLNELTMPLAMHATMRRMGTRAG